MLPMRRRIGSAPLRQPLVPEKNKSICSTISLAGKAMRNTTRAAWLQRYCEQQTPAYKPYLHQLGYSIFPISLSWPSPDLLLATLCTRLTVWSWCQLEKPKIMALKVQQLTNKMLTGHSVDVYWEDLSSLLGLESMRNVLLLNRNAIHRLIYT